MKPVASIDGLLEPFRMAARELPREAIPRLVGALSELQAELLIAPAPLPAVKDRELSPGEAATVLGRSRDWIYRHRRELPITRHPSGRWTISEARFRRWLDGRARQS